MSEIRISPKKLLFNVGGFLKRHKILSVSAVLIIVFLIFGIPVYKRMTALKNVPVNNEPVTSSLTRMDLTSSISLTGSIASGDARSVAASLTGTEIKEVNVSVGDYVEEGDVIITFDSSDLEKELETAKDNAALDDLKSQKTLEDAAEAVTDAKENYASEAAGLQTDVNIALSDYNQLVSRRDGALTDYQNAQAAVAMAQEQYDNLQNTKTVSENTVAQYETPLSHAENELAAAKQAESQALAAYEEYRSQADAAYGAYYGKLNTQTSSNEKNADRIEDSQYNYQITALEQSNNKKTQADQLQEAEERLGKTVITSPISGVITAVNVEEGDVYNGETLFVVQDMSHFVVEATVDEYDISKISKNLKAVIKTDATGDEELEGIVSFVAPTPNSTAASGGNTGTTNTSPVYTVRIDLKDYDERLRVGMTAKTSIVLDFRENVFAVAYDCVQTDKEGNDYIEVLDILSDNPQDRDHFMDTDNTGGMAWSTKKIFVESGMESDYYVEIISDELTEGMQVITTISLTSNTETGFVFGEETEFIYGEPNGGVMMETGNGPEGAPSGGPGGGRSQGGF